VSKLSNHTWYLCKSTGYIRSNAKGHPYMHRLIMNAPKGVQVDHINGDKLDNRKENLRLCSHRENVLNRPKHKNNTTGYKGVYFNKKRDVYQSFITINGLHKYLGSFQTAEEAYRAYCSAAQVAFGEFAHV